MTIKDQVKSNPNLTEVKGSQRQVAEGNNCDERSPGQRHGLNAQCRLRIRKRAGSADIRRAVTIGTSLQHKTKSSICRKVMERRSDNRVPQVIGITPGDPLVSRPVRVINAQGKTNVLGEVSRWRMRCRSNETGVVADGNPVRRRIGMDSPHQRPERCWNRMVLVNESGKSHRIL